MNQRALSTGRARRNVGMRRVSENAGAQWRAAYTTAITRWFARTHRGEHFTSETLRSVAMLSGVGQPHHFNAWSAMAGAFLRRWMKSGEIVGAGTTHSTRPQAHATRAVRYRKA